MTQAEDTREGRGLFERVRAILDAKGLDAPHVSRLSADFFGRSSHYFIPVNFYGRIRGGDSSPNIYQLYALSKISSYRLVDWLRVFRFELDEIPRLQVTLHGPRTVMLDSTAYDKDAGITWFDSVPARLERGGITPLAQVLTSTRRDSVSAIEQLTTKTFRYAKVGLEDAVAYPHLAPGSIVRFDPLVTAM